jgi:hypothetical protein
MKTFFALAVVSSILFTATAAPPLAYTGTESATTDADGGLRPVVGVQNIQIVRANRTAPDHADALGHTYQHQPMLAYWRGKFYLEYLSAPRNEHDSPTVNSLTTSVDGRHWTTPRIVFPAFPLPDKSETIAHQRMGFYVAPDGRLLVLGYYGKHPAPNDGTGIGRAVREIHEDGSFGPIYFIRLNTKQPFANFAPPYPLYSAAPDRGFVAACDALLGNKLMTAQWWEEDQLDESGFYSVKGKALSFVHRPDGSVLGIWKNALVATTTDAGRTWTEKEFATNLPNNASKYWLQHLPINGAAWCGFAEAQLTREPAVQCYALFLNPTNRLRHPLAVMTSSDGAKFSDLLAVHGELPDQRFPGGFKNPGPQYVRGIVEGNGVPPDAASAVRVVYSVNKEDIWISRVPAPIRGRVDSPVNESFETTAVGELPAEWNLYSPRWAPVQVIDAGAPAGHALELRDEDPYDYARAIRVFPETHGLSLSFKVLAKQANARLEVDLLEAHGARPVQLAFAEDGHLWARHEGIWNDAGPYAPDRWMTVSLTISKNPNSDTAELRVDGKAVVARAMVFTDPARTVERLSFRTGVFRNRGAAGKDLPGADQKSAAAVFLIDDVVITPEK